VRAGAREAMAHVLAFGRNGEERKAWTAPSAYSDQQWQTACIVDYADGNDGWLGAPTKARYAMPIRTPSGAIDRDALALAAASLPQTPLPAEVKRAAAKRLVRAHEEAGMEVHNRWLLTLADKSLATRTKASPVRVAEFRC
jgi:hypothetical protein